MQTIRLRFADQAAALDALRAAGWLTIDPETSAETVPPLVYVDDVRCDIDMIGTLYEQTGEMDAEGNAPTAALPGYHVNLLWWGVGTSAPVIGGEVVEPHPPLREWLI